METFYSVGPWEVAGSSAEDEDEGDLIVFMMRFDMRAPSTGAPATELYAAALDMAAWGEKNGCISAVLCEHHASEDGYLPTPLMLASAMAARTTTLPIMVAVVLLPLYDPVRLAEEMAAT